VSAPSRMCLLGFGEVGTILADDLHARGFVLSAWDLRFPDAGSAPARAVAERTVRVGSDARDSVRDVDLVISADTAVAHLAGALARPVWTAIRFQPEWRWLEGRSDPPWYPTMWLFRQPAIGDWESVFAEMSRYLERHWQEPR